MIYTVTLNPAIDYTIFPDTVEPGRIHRYERAAYGPGGKGINVAMLLSSFGVRVKALGFCAGFSGDEVLSLLSKAQCETDFIKLPEGNTRINIKICTPDGRETDFNENGKPVDEKYVEQLLSQLSELREGDTLVLAGSVPSGMDKDIYYRMLRTVSPHGVRTVVDATGDTLMRALTEKPFLIKPNDEELGELFGIKIESVSQAKECAYELVSKGAENVVVSMGDKGALLVNKNGAVFCHSVKGEVVSTVGAGDSLVAGFLYGMSLCSDVNRALQWGVAAGAATAFSQGIASSEYVKSLYSSVREPQHI